MTHTPHKFTRGFSLLEVLVAVVILSIGLLALASLQLGLIRSSSESKAQSVALGLIKDKIETLRSFTTLNGYIAMTDPADTTPSVGGVTYTLHTTVDRFVLDSATGNYVRRTSDTESESTITAALATFVPGRDFKRIVSKATWNEASGGSRSVTLDDVIDGLDPSDSAKVSKTTSSSTARSAKIIIKNPASEAGVIPIAISADGNTDTAATNPKPVVDSGGNETRFDILTYSALVNDTVDRLAQSRVETTVISCTCDTANKPTDTDARGYRPTYWNGFRYVAPTLTTYVPPAGQATFGHSDPDESPYCSSCCRDHHDNISGVTISGAKFDPWRGTHTHYGYNNSNVLTAVGVSGQTKYLESCRMIRVDGIYRVAADFNDEYYNLLKTKKNDNLTLEYVPTDGATTNYQGIVLDYLDNKIVSNSTPSTYNNTVAAATITTLETSRTINDPTTMTLARDGYNWLHSRGLYIDYLEAEALAAIASAKDLCVTNTCTAAQKSEAVLKLTPFTSINVSELSLFTPAAADNGLASVTDGSYYDPSNDTGTPVRGKITPAGTLPNPAQSVTATSAMLTSNSGLAPRSGSSVAIDTDETTKSDTQPITIPAGAAGNGGNFTVAFTGYDYGSGTLALSGNNVTTCTGSTTKTCTLSTSPTASLALVVSKYNYASQAATGLDVSCTNSDGKGGGTVTYTTKNSDPGLVRCNAYVVSSASSSPATTVSSPNVSTPAGSVNETTTYTFGSVATSAALTLTFTGPTKSFAGYTCTYTCSKATCATNGNQKTYTVTSTSATCP